MKKWIRDMELKSLNMVIDIPLAKDYGAVADLEAALVGAARVAVEFERSMTSAARYREIVGDIKREKPITC